MGSKSYKRKSSDGVSGPPTKKANNKVGPVNVKVDDVETTKVAESSDGEKSEKKKRTGYVEVTTLEKLESVEQILLDLRERK